MTAHDYRHGTNADMKADWRSESACHNLKGLERERLEAAFITEGHPLVEAAKEVCANCKVRIECLLSALTDPDSQGLRGGFFFDNGKVTKDDQQRLMREFGVRVGTRPRPRAKVYKADDAA